MSSTPGPEQEPMTHFLANFQVLANFQGLTTRPSSSFRRYSWRLLPLLAFLAAVAGTGSADAAPRARGAYDGIWNVVFATTRGNCSSGYSVPFMVSGGRVSSAGGGRVSGSVNRSGAVAVHVSVGASKASGGGRLGGSYGVGSWRGIITGDYCSGTWQATRG
jgi:hypothetical protein